MPCSDPSDNAPASVPIGGSALSSHGLIVDLFAGPGGWSEGLRMLGLTDVGIEFDDAACRTRRAAGHYVIRADVSQYPVEPFVGKTWGLIASPPCQAFSAAGSGKGRDFADELCAAVREERWDARPDPDPKVWLVLEPGRWIDAIRPEWVAMEQVPAVLPIWQEYARVLTRWGYATNVAIVNTADFGVPQTRERAVLLATTGVLRWPEPTHAKEPMESLFGPPEEPWVSWGDALGTPDTGEMEYQRGKGMNERHGDRPTRRATEPSFTVRAGGDGNGGCGPNFVIHPHEEVPA